MGDQRPGKRREGQSVELGVNPAGWKPQGGQHGRSEVREAEKWGAGRGVLGGLPLSLR